MSAAKDFFQNVGSVLTFGLIPPAPPRIDEVSEEDINKIASDASSILKASLVGFENIENEVPSILEKNLADSKVIELPAPPTHPYSLNNPINPFN